MPRFDLIAVGLTAVTFGLAGCSTPPPAPSTPPNEELEFSSQPPGADIRTSDGQSCRTPCSLTLQVVPLAVTFALKGFRRETVTVQAVQVPRTAPVQAPPSQDYYPIESSLPAVRFSPNPVEVKLEPEGKPAAKPRPMPRTAAKPPAPPPQVPAPPSGIAPPPMTTQPPTYGIPAPPPTPPMTSSPFPAPPQR